jgi:putative tryptophan/tyrosine transport system substrate-binding protein
VKQKSHARYLSLHADNQKSKPCTEPSRSIQDRKWLTVVAIVVALTLSGAVVHAQQEKKVSRIGYLSDSAPARETARSEAMGLALRELGYIEGNNIVMEYRYAAGKVDRAPELAAELVRLKVDIILIAGGPTQSRAAKNATTTIPIVMMGDGADPVETGLVESLARPGGNVTGLTLLNRELGGKRLELLKEAVPKLARVAFLHDPANPYNKRELKEILPPAARSLGLTIQPWPIQDANALEKELAAMGKQRPDGMYSTSSRQMIAIERRIAEFALKSGLPSVYAWREAVEAGGLMYYGADRADSYRRVAYYVDKILKGTKPADLPVEQPKKFELVFNLKTAKQIGLTIPPNVLARADRVIR